MATDKPRSPELAALFAPLEAPPPPKKGEIGIGNYPRLKGNSMAAGRSAGGHASAILANRRRRQRKPK